MLHGMTQEEMKRQYRAKQEQIRKLEADHAWFSERGTVPPRIGFRLEMARVEAEELRMWGHRDLTAGIREYREGRGKNLSISQHANRT